MHNVLMGRAKTAPLSILRNSIVLCLVAECEVTTSQCKECTPHHVAAAEGYLAGPAMTGQTQSPTAHKTGSAA